MKGASGDGWDVDVGGWTKLKAKVEVFFVGRRG